MANETPPGPPVCTRDVHRPEISALPQRQMRHPCSEMVEAQARLLAACRTRRGPSPETAGVVPASITGRVPTLAVAAVLEEMEGKTETRLRAKRFCMDPPQSETPRPVEIRLGDARRFVLARRD